MLSVAIYVVILNVVMLSVAIYVVILNVVMLSVVMLNVVMLNVLMLSVVMLNIVAPAKRRLVTTALRRIKTLQRVTIDSQRKEECWKKKIYQFQIGL
jgi:hypothetical protein